MSQLRQSKAEIFRMSGVLLGVMAVAAAALQFVTGSTFSVVLGSLVAGFVTLGTFVHRIQSKKVPDSGTESCSD